MTKRGTKRSDVVSLRLYSAAELEGIRVLITPVAPLAIRFFLGRHAERRAQLIVGGLNNGSEEGRRGS